MSTDGACNSQCFQKSAHDIRGDGGEPTIDAEDASSAESSSAEPLDDKVEIARLAALSPLDYDRQREAVAQKLRVRTVTLDKAVKAARGGGGPTGQGQAIEFDEIDPWPYPVDGAKLLDRIGTALRSCVALEPWQGDIVALWILHDHAIEAWNVTPRLGFTAPAPGCGKTQSLRFVKHMVVRPYMCVMVTDATGAAANRDADNWKPLFAIADVVGNGWGERAIAAAKRILALEANRSYGEMVLVDIKTIIDAGTANEFPSAEIVDRLVDLPGRPWTEYGRQQKPITQTALAKLLAPFKIVTGKVGAKDNRLNGYTRQQFEDAFKRYLSPSPLSDRTPGQNTMDAKQAACSQPDTGVQLETSQKPNNGGLMSGCPDLQGGCSHKDDPRADLEFPRKRQVAHSGCQDDSLDEEAA